MTSLAEVTTPLVKGVQELEEMLLLLSKAKSSLHRPGEDDLIGRERICNASLLLGGGHGDHGNEFSAGICVDGAHDFQSIDLGRQSSSTSFGGWRHGKEHAAPMGLLVWSPHNYKHAAPPELACGASACAIKRQFNGGVAVVKRNTGHFFKYEPHRFMRLFHIGV